MTAEEIRARAKDFLRLRYCPAHLQALVLDAWHAGFLAGARAASASAGDLITLAKEAAE